MTEQRAFSGAVARDSSGTFSHEGSRFPPHLAAGLDRLRQAHDYAVDAGSDAWQFAVEIGDLRAVGMTTTDFRWLITKGYVEHGHETSLYGDPTRSFRPSAGLSFLRSTSFILTPAGSLLVCNAMAAAIPSPQSETASNDLPNSSSSLHQRAADLHGAHSPRVDRPRIMQGMEVPSVVLRRLKSDVKPIWEARNRELRVDGMLVKKFRVPARNQELILAAFQEEGWPDYIDDPLPMKSEIVPKRRLHNVINRLNGGQFVSVLRFHGNGNGEGVGWGFLPGRVTREGKHATRFAFADL